MKILFVILLAFATGCGYALRPHVPAFERTIHITVLHPTQYFIQVETAKKVRFPVEANGFVHVIVPESPRACDRYLFGKINLGGSGWPRIHLIRKRQKVLTLSPLELYDQEAGENGVYELKLQ